MMSLWTEETEGMVKLVVERFFRELGVPRDTHLMAQLMNLAKRMDYVELNGGTVWTAGNGGSASTASHAAGDWTKAALGSELVDDQLVRAACLTDVGALLSALENDYGREKGLAQLARRFVSENDVVVLFSVSGRSENIVELAEFCRKSGVMAFAFVGAGLEADAPLRKAARVIESKSMDYGVVETEHLGWVHAVARALVVSNGGAV